MAQTQPPPVPPGPPVADLPFKVKDEPYDWTLANPGTCGGNAMPTNTITNSQPFPVPNDQVPQPTQVNPPAAVDPTKKSPKKRGRPKKDKNAAPAVTVKQEPGTNGSAPEQGGALPQGVTIKKEGVKVKQEKITEHGKVRKKRERFGGLSEEEVLKKTLPDLICPNLDILIVGINPGLTAAYTGHHYAGPGNHFWKCLFLSGLIPEQLNGYVDHKMLQYGIGSINIVNRTTRGSKDLTNSGKCVYLSGLIPEPLNAYHDQELVQYGIGFTSIVARTTRGSADLTRKEIAEGGEILKGKVLKFKPRIAVFNGKGIYEVFCGKKDFWFGKQPDHFPECPETLMYVMPSSSARCTQLPRAVDKVPFYAALKKLRDHLRGTIQQLDDSEVCFPDVFLKTAESKKNKEENADGVKKEPGTEGDAAKKPEKVKKPRKRKSKGGDDGATPPKTNVMPGMVPPHMLHPGVNPAMFPNGMPMAMMVKSEPGTMPPMSQPGMMHPGMQPGMHPGMHPGMPHHGMHPNMHHGMHPGMQHNMQQGMPPQQQQQQQNMHDQQQQQGMQQQQQQGMQQQQPGNQQGMPPQQQQQQQNMQDQHQQQGMQQQQHQGMQQQQQQQQQGGNDTNLESLLGGGSSLVKQEDLSELVNLGLIPGPGGGLPMTTSSGFPMMAPPLAHMSHMANHPMTMPPPAHTSSSFSSSNQAFQPHPGMPSQTNMSSTHAGNPFQDDNQQQAPPSGPPQPITIAPEEQPASSSSAFNFPQNTSPQSTSVSSPNASQSSSEASSSMPSSSMQTTPTTAPSMMSQPPMSQPGGPPNPMHPYWSFANQYSQQPPTHMQFPHHMQQQYPPPQQGMPPPFVPRTEANASEGNGQSSGEKQS